MSNGLCSPSQYDASDASTSSAFSSSPSSDATLTCEGPPPPPVPCDLEDIILNEIVVSRQSEYRRSGGQWVAQPITPSSRAISLQGVDGGAPRHDHIEVVGERPGTAAVTRIRTMVYPFASHDSSHVLVTVTRPGESDLVRRFPHQGTVDFDVYRRVSDSTIGGIFERYFTLHLSPARYRITGESCGVRHSGRPVVSGQLDVLVYPQDQYTLTLSVPPIGRRSYTRSRSTTAEGTTDTTTRQGVDAAGAYQSTQSTTRSGDTTTTSTDHTSSGYTVSRQTSTTTLEDGSAIRIDSSDVREASPDSPSLELKKNGAAEDVSANLTSLLHALRSVENAVAAIRDLVRNWVPQVGFRFEVSVSFFSGSISMAWGWKEYTDYRVYFSWVASITLWLFKVGLSLSFGISIGPGTLRVVGEIADAGVEVTTSWEFNRPGHIVLPPTARARGTLPVEVRGEAVLDIYVTRVSRAAGVRSGFTVEGGTRLTSSSAVEMYASIAWAGLDAFVQSQNPGEGVSEDVYHLIDRSDIWSGQVPV